jgi:23S rRNA (guanosine2251-2'-O)-methyltransferase
VRRSGAGKGGARRRGASASSSRRRGEGGGRAQGPPRRGERDRHGPEGGGTRPVGGGGAYTGRGRTPRPAGEAPAAIVGRRPVWEALRAGRPLVRILVAAEAAAPATGSLRPILVAARAAGIPVERTRPQALERLAEGAAHQGVVALPAASAYAPAGSVLARALSAAEPALILVLDGVEDPGNVGSLLRSAEAAGAHGAVLPQRRAAGLTVAAVKASAGAVHHLPVERVTNMARYLEELKAKGVWVVGAHPAAEAEVYDVDLTVPVAVVVGGEGRGLHRLVRERCDHLVRLPMRGEVASLNAAVAGALVLYEAVRQRRARRSEADPAGRR